jgi:hypothetical protein
MEQLGCNIAGTGVQPNPKKVQAIQAIKVPETCTQQQGFVGVINSHRDTWKSH